jgi:hypothetical protein
VKLLVRFCEHGSHSNVKKFNLALLLLLPPALFISVRNKLSLVMGFLLTTDEAKCCDSIACTIPTPTTFVTDFFYITNK